MGTQSNAHFIVHIIPVGVMLLGLRRKGYFGHEGKSLGKIGEGEVGFEGIVFFLPHIAGVLVRISNSLLLKDVERIYFCAKFKPAMALTESNMLPIGTQAPAFNLPDTVSGNQLQYDDVSGENGTVVLFLCNHCPYVIHVNDELVRVAADYQAKGVGFVAISSNDAEKYPMDGPEKMTEHAKTVGYNFPYLYDESQQVARAYDAACTPDIYVFDQDQNLYYRGRLDGSRPGNDAPLTGADLRQALDDMLAGKPAPTQQFPSAGCNIKWK